MMMCRASVARKGLLFLCAMFTCVLVGMEARAASAFRPDGPPINPGAGPDAGTLMTFDFPVALAFPGKGYFSGVFTTKVTERPAPGGGNRTTLSAMREKEMVLRSSGAPAQAEIIRVFREFGERLAFRRTEVGRGGPGLDTTPTSSPEVVFRLPPLEAAGWTIRPGGGLGVQAHGAFVVGGMSFRLSRVGRAVNMDRYFSAWGVRYSKLVDPGRPENVFYALPLGMDSDEAVFFYLYKGAMYQLRFVFPHTAPVHESLAKVLPVAYGIMFPEVGEGGAQARCMDDFGVGKSAWNGASMGEKRRFLVRLSRFLLRTMRFGDPGQEGREGLGIIELRGGLPLFVDSSAEPVSESFGRARGQLDRTVDLLIRASGPRGETFSPARFLDACIGVVYSPDSRRGDRYVFLTADRAVFFIPPHGGREAVLRDIGYGRFGGGAGSPMGSDGDMAVFAGEKVLRSRVLSEFLDRLFQGGDRTFVSLFRCSETDTGTDTKTGAGQ